MIQNLLVSCNLKKKKKTNILIYNQRYQEHDIPGHFSITKLQKVQALTTLLLAWWAVDFGNSLSEGPSSMSFRTLLVLVEVPFDLIFFWPSPTINQQKIEISICFSMWNWLFKFRYNRKETINWTRKPSVSKICHPLTNYEILVFFWKSCRWKNRFETYSKDIKI
jgi:hypothetical protein